MSNEFNITSELKEKTLILKTDGYINNTGGEKMLQEFSKHYSSGISSIILDLEKSKVVNSIGISYLIELIEQINQNNGKIFFTNLDPAIEKTFKIMGLFQYAEKADSSNSVF
jgi:anti-anti-sigma factor